MWFPLNPYAWRRDAAERDGEGLTRNEAIVVAVTAATLAWFVGSMVYDARDRANKMEANIEVKTLEGMCHEYMLESPSKALPESLADLEFR